MSQLNTRAPRGQSPQWEHNGFLYLSLTFFPVCLRNEVPRCCTSPQAASKLLLSSPLHRGSLFIYLFIYLYWLIFFVLLFFANFSALYVFQFLLFSLYIFNIYSVIHSLLFFSFQFFWVCCNSFLVYFMKWFNFFYISILSFCSLFVVVVFFLLFERILSFFLLWVILCLHYISVVF